jgi:hypothetical protein
MVRKIPVLEEILDPCVRVIKTESYGEVLDRVVRGWRERWAGLSLYQLEKEKVLSSKPMLLKALKRLTECGYAVYVEAEARGRKDYYPTPLGMAMDVLLKLYSPEEMGVELEDEDLRRRYFDMACQCIGETISRHMGLIFRLTYPLYAREDWAGNIFYVETDWETLVKGFKTAQYLAMLICMAAEKPFPIPSPEEDIPRLRRVVERVEKHLQDLGRGFENRVDFMLFGSKILDHLMKTYRSMDMYIDQFYRIAPPLEQMRLMAVERVGRDVGKVKVIDIRGEYVFEKDLVVGDADKYFEEWEGRRGIVVGEKGNRVAVSQKLLDILKWAVKCGVTLTGDLAKIYEMLKREGKIVEEAGESKPRDRDFCAEPPFNRKQKKRSAEHR